METYSIYDESYFAQCDNEVRRAGRYRSMLSLFPLHYLSLLAYFLLRVVIGIICIHLGSKLVTRAGAKHKAIGVLLTVAGVQFVLGFYTQIASIIVASISFLGGIVPGTIPQVTRSFLLLLWAVSVTLFITGAGIFAFDLPI